MGDLESLVWVWMGRVGEIEVFGDEDLGFMQGIGEFY